MTDAAKDGGARMPPTGASPSLDAPGPLTVAPAVGAFGAVSRGLRTRGTQWLFVGAAVAAVGAYVFQVVGARSLGEVGYAPISALWTIQYLVVSVVLYPTETLVTRRTLLDPTGDRNDAWLRKVWLWVGGIAVALAGACWLARDPLFHGLDDLALVVAAVTVAFAAFMIVRGRLAGTERFKAYGLVTASESMGRAVLGLVVASAGATTRAFAWVMPLGAAAAAGLWLSLRKRPREPRAISVGPASAPRPVRFLAFTTGANGILQLMLAGGPLVLVFLGAAPRTVSILFVTLAAARVPLVFVFSGLLSRLLPTFLRLAAGDDERDLRRTVTAIAAGTAALAAIGGLAAAAVGASLIGLLFGTAFAPPWWVAAGVTAGVLLATGSMVLGQVLVAQGNEDLALAAWTVALLAAAIAMAAVGGSDMERVVAAFVAGETVAALALAVCARRPSLTSRLRRRPGPGAIE